MINCIEHYVPFIVMMINYNVERGNYYFQQDGKAFWHTFGPTFYGQISVLLTRVIKFLFTIRKQRLLTHKTNTVCDKTTFSVR